MLSSETSEKQEMPSSVNLLDEINSPADLKNLPRAKLPQLAAEIRKLIVEVVSRTGGHLASSLGAVELAIAVHYVFDTPKDRVIWDVGHQAYAHKILTGRRADFPSLRQHGGLSGFTRRSESPYDSFSTGHSGTSISAGLGMACANFLKKEDAKVVAVIGDGSLTAGLAYEGLNQAGGILKRDLIVILNDNEMSISRNVGALSNYFARLLSGRIYDNLRENSKKVLRTMPVAWELVRRSEVHAKGMILPSTVFEELGFNYVGPIDGHNVDLLVSTLRNMRQLKGPQFLHVVTQKGKGYAPAEADPILWHGPGPFDPASGEMRKEAASGPSYSQIFG